MIFSKEIINSLINGIRVFLHRGGGLRKFRGSRAGAERLQHIERKKKEKEREEEERREKSKRYLCEGRDSKSWKV